MIEVTKMNHSRSILNSDLIEHLESTPDTVISLTNGHKMVVLEPADEIVRRVVEFRQRIAGTLPLRQATSASGKSLGVR